MPSGTYGPKSTQLLVTIAAAQEMGVNPASVIAFDKEKWNTPNPDNKQGKTGKTRNQLAANMLNALIMQLFHMGYRGFKLVAQSPYSMRCWPDRCHRMGQLRPVRVIVAVSDSLVQVKLADEAGGIGRSSLPNVWSYRALDSRWWRAAAGGLRTRALPARCSCR